MPDSLKLPCRNSTSESFFQDLLILKVWFKWLFFSSKRISLLQILSHCDSSEIWSEFFSTWGKLHFSFPKEKKYKVKHCTWEKLKKKKMYIKRKTIKLKIRKMKEKIKKTEKWKISYFKYIFQLFLHHHPLSYALTEFSKS